MTVTSLFRPSARNLVVAAASAAVGAVAMARRLARRRRYFDLRDKVAVVTGGSRGLGLVLARELAHAGAKVAICARNAAELARARAELEASGAEVLALTCDVTSSVEVAAMLVQVRDGLGPVDVLINNAGVIQVGPVEAMTPEDYDRALQVHFWGPLFTILGVLPDMRRRGTGRIVNVASFGGKISIPHLLPYSASKFALVGLSEGLRAALIREGIYVTTICPGLMRTGSARHAWFKGRHRQEFTWFSIGASLPLLSMAAPRAARRILRACQWGDAELAMPVLAAGATKLHTLAPDIGIDIVSLAEQFLPGSGGIGRDMRRGADSASRWSPSMLTLLGDRAALTNNQF